MTVMKGSSQRGRPTARTARRNANRASRCVDSTVPITSMAKAKVTNTWLVTVEVPGIRPDQVGEEHEDEEREHKREELQPLLAGRRADRIRHEFIEHLGGGLQRAGDQRALARVRRP